jgi:hypothetical protein
VANSPSVEVPDLAERCPICEQQITLCTIEKVLWGPRPRAERLEFRCSNCGVTQTQWSSVPIDARLRPKTAGGMTIRTPRRVLESKSTTRVIEYTIIVGGVAIVIIAAIKSLGFG